jgi:hypothetical protein
MNHVSGGCSLTRSLPFAVLYLSPALRAQIRNWLGYPALKCWAIVGRPLRGRY